MIWINPPPQARGLKQVANPKGGEVQTVSVVDPAARQAMTRIEVGDTITAYQTESLLIGIDNP